VTDTAISRASLVAGIEAAALVLAQQLGLGDETQTSDDWPIGEGDAVLSMPFAGDPNSSLVLAVNDDVAERLLSNTSLLVSTFAAATQVFNDTTGAGLEPTTVTRAEVLQPAFIAEILDNGSLTAVAGITLPIESAPQPERQPEPEAYEPAPIVDTSGFGVGVGVGVGGAAASSLHVLHDVELVVTAELGRTTMPVRDLLGLAPGMVVEIDRAAGSPIDLLVNGRKIAAGEVVVIDEEYGIRITEIAPTGEHAR
jgi:flagellar motor switch protein FliN/FliY